MSTNVVSSKDIKRDWHFIDVSGKVLGRSATGIAKILMGKHKSNFVPYLDQGDYVVVTNASKVEVTGRKRQQKEYVRHSGYPGGLKKENFSKLVDRRPEVIIKHAVWGMLPHTKLGKSMIKKLKIFAGNKHPYEKIEEGISQPTGKD